MTNAATVTDLEIPLSPEKSRRRRCQSAGASHHLAEPPINGGRAAPNFCNIAIAPQTPHCRHSGPVLIIIRKPLDSQRVMFMRPQRKHEPMGRARFHRELNAVSS